MSITIDTEVSLKSLNTFGVDAIASQYCRITSTRDMIKLLAEHKPALVLGGGSNLLFVDERIEGLVLQPHIKGIEAISFDDEHVLVTAQSGENWHQLVGWCLEHNYGGLENLSLIPGSVGAAPVQNIGAYGVELADTLYQVEAINIDTGEPEMFSNSECRFTYRDSIFKSDLQSTSIITSASFLLTKKKHRLNLSHDTLAERLRQRGISGPGIRDISQAIIAIRQNNLPDPAKTPNAGSFFKNPVISGEAYREICRHYPDAPGFELPKQMVKVPAGWLIEQCGWKGFRGAHAGVHDRHALILVNHHGASGLEIYELSMDIIHSVLERFGITLEREVGVIGDMAGRS